jgi:hypothetical protein
MVNPWLSSLQAAGKQRGRSIIFYEPKSDEVTTNLHQLAGKKDSLKQLEEDLYKSMQTFSGSSLDGIPAPLARPPTGPVIPSKRVREALERRKNAIFLTPEDLAPATTAEDIFKLPEYGAAGMEQKTPTPIEKYYERMDSQHADSLKSTRSKDGGSSDTSHSGRDGSTSHDDSDTPPALLEREQDLKNLMNPEAADNAMGLTSSHRNTFSDIFGLGDTTPSKEKALEHKKFMADFYSIREPIRSGLAPADGAKSALGNLEMPRRSASPFGGPNLSFGDNNQFTTINPLFTPAAPKDINLQPLGQGGAAYQLPKALSPKPPVAPTFTAPTRPF